MTSLASKLSDLLGASGWVPGSEAAGHARDWLDRYGAPPLGVARPATTEEVSAVIRACVAEGVPVTPQGGNTSLCGAAVSGAKGGVILSLARMARIGTPDPDAGCIEVEAGVVLASLHETLAPHGLIFPMHLGAEGSAQIGGLIATNAGGSHAARFGMMGDLVLGLEVVLPDGQIWDGMRAVMKDNAGYALRRLFCGAEGTLGIVTRAVLRTYSAPKRRATALLAIPDVSSLIRMGTMLRAQAGEMLTGLEFFNDVGQGYALRHVAGLTHPLDTRTPWYLLAELSAGSEQVPVDLILETALTEGMKAELVSDGTLAMSEAQRAALWRLREEQPEGQRLEGPQLKHDISVPPGRLGAFIEQGAALVEGILPGTRINPFGHLGDGNVHYNLSPPEGGDFGTHAPAMAGALGRLATELGGSFAAEHGLGRSKVALADTLRDKTERDLMRRLKACLDPEGLLNPGVIVAVHDK